MVILDGFTLWGIVRLFLLPGETGSLELAAAAAACCCCEAVGSRLCCGEVSFFDRCFILKNKYVVNFNFDLKVLHPASGKKQHGPAA